ncbi:hypothetical protein OsJ_14866 [Oryza sativa Japonica Group]|uniref:Uncharacterized protein n=1 Tax=Oryza sativa subsp. japonica TaxID=39947 RepID=A3AU10_ORYSJ|nr:hypothetical protein OsJ_14866 [Oryza sativa Japonica Group]
MELPCKLPSTPSSHGYTPASNPRNLGTSAGLQSFAPDNGFLFLLWSGQKLGNSLRMSIIIQCLLSRSGPCDTFVAVVLLFPLPSAPVQVADRIFCACTCQLRYNNWPLISPPFGIASLTRE